MATKSKASAHGFDEFFLPDELDPMLDTFEDQAEFQPFEEKQKSKQAQLTPAQLDQLERDRTATKAHQDKALRAEDSGHLIELVGTPEAVKHVVILCREREHRTELLEAYAQEITHLPIEFLTAESVLDSERLLEELHQAVCRLKGFPLEIPVETVIERLQEEVTAF